MLSEIYESLFLPMNEWINKRSLQLFISQFWVYSPILQNKSIARYKLWEKPELWDIEKKKLRVKRLKISLTFFIFSSVVETEISFLKGVQSEAAKFLLVDNC